MKKLIAFFSIILAVFVLAACAPKAETINAPTVTPSKQVFDLTIPSDVEFTVDVKNGTFSKIQIVKSDGVEDLKSGYSVEAQSLL